MKRQKRKLLGFCFVYLNILLTTIEINTPFNLSYFFTFYATEGGFSLGNWITKKLNPNATTADTGGTMEAYFDKDLKVWVFPGEDPAEKAKPLAPPPTSTSKKVCEVDKSISATTSTANDPLASLISPPARVIRVNKDPLDSLMSPPARPPSNYRKSNTQTLTSVTLNSSMKTPAKTPQFAIFKPIP